MTGRSKPEPVRRLCRAVYTRKLIVNEALRDEVTANNREKRVAVARATVGEDGLDIDLRHDGFVAPASLMTPEREHAA